MIKRLIFFLLFFGLTFFSLSWNNKKNEYKENTLFTNILTDIFVNNLTEYNKQVFDNEMVKHSNILVESEYFKDSTIKYGTYSLTFKDKQGIMSIIKNTKKERFVLGLKINEIRNNHVFVNVFNYSISYKHKKYFIANRGHIIIEYAFICSNSKWTKVAN